MKKRFIEIAVKVIVAALTAFLTAITTTSCMGYGPLPKIVQISQMKNLPVPDCRGDCRWKDPLEHKHYPKSKYLSRKFHAFGFFV
jgi:hypothetical protein